MHSKEDLNCYFFRIICSNTLNSDNVKTKLESGIIVCKQWHQRKREKIMLTTAELTEKTEREKNYNEIKENT